MQESERRLAAGPVNRGAAQDAVAVRSKDGSDIDRRILVVPDDGLYLAFRLLPIIRRAGYAVDLLSSAVNLQRHSRYVSQTYTGNTIDAICSMVVDEWTRSDKRWKQIVIADERVVRQLIAATAPELLQQWQPGCQQQYCREFFRSKAGLVLVEQPWDLPIPQSRVCQSIGDVRRFFSSVDGSIIVKPLDQAGGIGVYAIPDRRTLEMTANILRFPLLAQRFIHGQRGVVDMLCSAGKVLACLTSYSTKRAGSCLGPSTARQFQRMRDLEPLIEKVAARSQFEGICGFDFIEEEGTGKFYLIEFHPRPPSGVRFGLDCGVDFAKAMAAWLAGRGKSFVPESQAEGSSVAAHYFSADLMRCFRQKDWPGLCAWLPLADTVHDIFWDDAPLLFAWLTNRLFQKRRSEIR